MTSFLDAAVGIATEAGSLLRSFADRKIGYELKSDFDLVTEADRASEKLVVERLRGLFPDHSIQAEEGGGGEQASDYRWYVDPLDGTTNFAHGYPAWSVTLALEKAGELIAGVVFDPSHDELFAAERGAGAFLNGRRIRVSATKKLSHSLGCTGFPNSDRFNNPNIRFFYQMALETHGVRRGGSAAIDLSYTACGRLDAFWEIGLNPWDLAAGKLLVAEAGGVVTDMNGAPHAMKSPGILATNAELHAEYIARFAAISRGEGVHPIPPFA